jgi:hypothetical protein
MRNSYWHEIASGVSLDVGYYRTWFGNFSVTDNRVLTPADFDRFSILAPSDPRLPGGGGYEVSGLYNVKPAMFSVPADNLITFVSKYGKQINHWNGVDVTLNARPRPDLMLQGGTTTGRTTTDNCGIVDDLPELVTTTPASMCHQQFKFLTQLKLIGTYTVPRVDVQITATMQSVPGPEILANYTATNAVVAPRLGRSLSGGAANTT